MKLTDLMQKDVINDDDGNKLGRIIDINLELDGSINSIIINKGIKFSNIFSSKEQVVVEWEKILKIGNDVIIVDYRKKKIDKKT